jgi:hypothetical protein
MLASLILGAHFLRDGHMLFVLLCLLFPFLLLIRRRWVLLHAVGGLPAAFPTPAGTISG